MCVLLQLYQIIVVLTYDVEEGEQLTEEVPVCPPVVVLEVVC